MVAATGFFERRGLAKTLAENLPAGLNACEPETATITSSAMVERLMIGGTLRVAPIV